MKLTDLLITGQAQSKPPRQSLRAAELAGKPAGSISAVAYNAAYGFLGSYIVAPDYRGKGFCLKLWRTAMAHLNGRNVGLDSGAERGLRRVLARKRC
jgi:acetyltransferase (GNAT) family protein